MITVDLPNLIKRLHPIAHHALENAAAYCVSHQQAEITVPQFLLQLLETPLSDMRVILNQAEVNNESLRLQLREPSMSEPATTTAYPTFSPLLVEWLKDSWLLASVELHHSVLRSGVLLLALLHSPHRYLPAAAARLLLNVNRDLLRENFINWTSESAENAADENQTDKPASTPAGQKASLLARFASDITHQARKGQLDPVLCRDKEIDLLIDILCRRRKNNPIVVGEAGVGKSALIEGLALRIVAGQVPDQLRQTRLMSLDLGALQAGAAVKGEFEKRLKGLMKEVTQSAEPVILFIDEAHTLIGAGNQQGGLDVSNLLKPALARGELKTIAATTWSEYKKYIEKDAALSRRFQVVKVMEPTAAEATVILRGLRSIYEKAHGVLIDDDALHAAAALSERYLSGRQLPDKAIDVLDTACARVAINLSSPPRQLSALMTRQHQLRQQIEQQEREQRLALSADADQLTQLKAQQAENEAQLSALEQSWQQQKKRVEEVIALRADLLQAENYDNTQHAVLVERLAELKAMQKDQSLVSPHVGRPEIAAVIAEWTGIPLNRLSQSELVTITEMPAWLGQTIRGQTLAIEKIHQHLLTARADLRRAGRPLGAFLLVGPSGVGKTESVLQIADTLFGGHAFLTTINMSEFQEKHTVSRLIGSPPGYVGYGEGGVLTEAIRQKPWSVVLLDEVEKAHPDVLNLFYQAFDKGEMADGEGRTIDCKNVLFFLTSNLGDQVIVEHAANPEKLQEALWPVLTSFFRPALLARMEVIPFLPLDNATLTEIVVNKLDRLKTNLSQRFSASVIIEDEIIEEIMRRITHTANGARMLESIIDGALLPPLSLLLLQHMAANNPVSTIRLYTREHEFQALVDTQG